MAVDLDTWAKAAEERLIGAPLGRAPCRPGELLHKIPRSRLAGQRALWKKLALAVFLASEAAASITGVDGGWTAH
jgi:hypothetical protein